MHFSLPASPPDVRKRLRPSVRWVFMCGAEPLRLKGPLTAGQSHRLTSSGKAEATAYAYFESHRRKLNHYWIIHAAALTGASNLPHNQHYISVATGVARLHFSR
jgi:hypothetical protein